MVTKTLVTLPIGEVHPYENNPRLNDEAVADVMESIKQCTSLDPIEIDENNVILCGHTRLKAYQKLKFKEVDCIQYVGLSDEQKIKYRLLNNKTAERADWDVDKLLEELDKVDFEGYDFGFDLGELENEEEDNPYSPNANIPQYEITGAKPQLAELMDNEKAKQLISHIEQASEITEAEREFLIEAAKRHNVFNYRNIAEYYANATPEMQALMEESALVIIDIGDAIAHGYAKLTQDIQDMADEDDEE